MPTSRSFSIPLRLAACVSLCLAPILSLQADTNSVFVCFNSTLNAANTNVLLTITNPGSGWNYSAAAQVDGTKWNQIACPSPQLAGTNTNLGTFSIVTASNAVLTNPAGVATAIRLNGTITITGVDSNHPTPSTIGWAAVGSLTPTGLMNNGWRIYKSANTCAFTFSGLSTNAAYLLYAYASGLTNTNTTYQGTYVKLATSNVPAGGASYLDVPGSLGGQVFASNAGVIAPVSRAAAGQTNSAVQAPWGVIQAKSDSAGTLSITCQRPGTVAASSFSGISFNGFQLTPYPLPAITTQPASLQTNPIGGIASLNVTATNWYATTNLTYRWQKGGTNITDGATGNGGTYSGSTTPVLSISNIASGDGGNYTAVISNPGGSVTSTVAALSVIAALIPPSITTQPASQSVWEGSPPATFTVATIGDAPLVYQWQYSADGGGSWSNVGSNSGSLIITAATLSDTGLYQVIVTNAAGSATSLAATLTLLVAPSITAQPSNQTTASGSPSSFSVSASGSAPLSYQWQHSVDGITRWSNVGSNNSSLTISQASLPDGGSYRVIVTNGAGSLTSTPATLTVTVTSPSIAAQPSSQSAWVGFPVALSVSASGSAPLAYQWRHSTDGGTSWSNVGSNISSLAIASASLSDGGLYQVIVSNAAGSVTSSTASLGVTILPPTITAQPAPVAAYSGGTAVFSASAASSTTLRYQWLRNGSAIAGATNAALILPDVQPSAEGTYSLQAFNSLGMVTSGTAPLLVTTAPPLPDSAFNLTGFANQTTGGGVIPETDPAYRKVTNAMDFATAILSSYKTPGSVKVIEIMNDLDLGWNEIGTGVQTLASSPFRAHNPAQLHPRLLVTGVSLIDIQPKGGLTIFSANGATIRHATFNIKNTANVIVRNLKFDEMWEWDEASKGNYDKNDWDFIDLGNGGAVSNIWIDHCTFTKTYDGILDTKAGSSGITVSWCKYVGDDGATNPNSFVWQQINALESNKAAYSFYNFLRVNGYSPTDIVTIIQGHDKTHLAGANVFDSNNATISMTFHHLWLNSVWDRCVPRLRGGNVHDYNILVDDSLVFAAKTLRNTRAAAMSTANQNTLNNTYSFDPPINGSISTESGALLVEKSVYINCLSPLRNNQTDTNNPAYTGKIMALDSIYRMNTAYFRGDSTDAGGTNTFGPVQAPVIPFSWNLTNGILPYVYTPDNPAQLQSIVAAGAGAGVVAWDKSNWLKTSYSPTAPGITAQPRNITVPVGFAAAFAVAASGSTPLYCQWQKSGDGLTFTNVQGATNLLLAINSAVTSETGFYNLVASNAAGAVTSSAATLAIGKISVSSMEFGSLSFPYNGDPRPVSVSTVPTGLGVTVTYGGSTNPPSDIGTYALTAVVNDANYQGSNSGTLTIYDAVALWRQSYFGTANNSGNAADGFDANGNGLSNLQDYTLGNDPTRPTVNAPLGVTSANGGFTVQFLAKAAGTDSGYAGLMRYYALEGSTNLTNASWSGVPGYTNIVASNQTVTYSTNCTASPSLFFRVRAWLK